MKVKTKGSKSESYPQPVRKYDVVEQPTRTFYIGQSYDGNEPGQLTRAVGWNSADALSRYIAEQTSLYSGNLCYHVMQAENVGSFELTQVDDD